MEIDLRGKRPALDFDKLYAGDVMPLTVRGVTLTEESVASVMVETITPLRINSGSVRINHGGFSTAFVSAKDASPYVLELAIDESDVAGIPSAYNDSALLLTYGAAVPDETAPTFEHSELGVLPGFVRRVSDRVFVIPLALSKFSLTGAFDAIEDVTITVDEIEEGDDETRAEFSISFSGTPDGGFWLISDSTGSTGKLHHSASAREIEKALSDAGISGFRVYVATESPQSFFLVADSPGVVETPIVESHFVAPSGFTATLDLSDLTLRASLAGIQSQSCILSVVVDNVTVFSDLIPLMRLFDGGLLNVGT
jgi:hypothetical protein